MKRWLLHFACVLSLLLGIGVAIGWAASAAGTTWPVYVVPPLEAAHVGGRRVFLGATPRSFGLYVIKPLAYEDRTPEQWATWKPKGPPRYVERHFFGFQYVNGDAAVWGIDGIKWADRWFVLSLPNALAVPLFLAPPVACWTRAFRRSRRRRRGLCVRCGYDLQASRHRCPECGARPLGR